MASQLQLRRGTTVQHVPFIGAPAEVTVDTDKKTVVVHDGTTPGGFPSATAAELAAGLATKVSVGAAAGGALSGTYPNPTLAPVIATGSTAARSVQDRFADVVNVKDFGAVGDGVTDDTAAFQAACATGKTVIAIGTFKLTGEVLVYGQLLGVLGQSTLNLTVTGVANGLVLQSGSTVSGFLINRVRDRAGTSATGANGNAIAVWPSPNGSPVPQLFSDITISNLRIVASGDEGNVITCLGNIKRFVIENVSISGFFGQGLLIHWRRLGQAPFDSYHPRQGQVRNVKIAANAAPTSGATSSDTAMTLAATHDLMVSNVTTVNTRRGVVVSAGDIGGTFSDFTGSESFGRVMTNMHFENIACINHSSSGFWVAGRSDFQSSINNKWFMPNGGVTATNVTVEAGDDSTNSLEPIHLEFANGVNIQGANVFVKAGRESVVTTAYAVYFTGATDCSVSGVFRMPRGIRSFSSSGCQITNSKFEHPAALSSVSSGNYGVDLDSQSFTAVVDGAVSAGATTITLTTVPCTIMAGTVFTSSGNKFYFNGPADVTTTTTTTIKILPAVASIANGDTITIQKGTFDLELVGSSFKGYDRAIQSQGTATASVNSITVNSCAFQYSRRDHIFLEYTKNAEISNNYFNLGNQTVGSTAADVNVRNTDAAIIKANCFNQELDTQSIFGVYVLAGTKGVVIEGNTFWQHQTDIATHPLASAVYLNGSGASGEQDVILASNWFASTVTNQVLPAASRRSVSIGSNRVGFATAAPTAGVWRQGDRIYNISAAAGQPSGWVCTVAGEAGTWVALPSVDLSGSATFDPANLVDGDGETTTVTVTGAALGDYAQASFSLNLQGITLTAWVSAANTVSVRFQNETGGTLDLGSGTLRARVFKP